MPRMEYGRTEPHLREIPGGIEAIGGPAALTLSTDLSLRIQDGAILGEFDVVAGQRVDLRLTYTPTFGPKADPRSTPTLEQTTIAWTSWAALHSAYDGDYPEQVRRSSLVLQGLTYGPSGAIVAAATTSLPETLGGG